jgi:hypothetical protein
MTTNNYRNPRNHQRLLWEPKHHKFETLEEMDKFLHTYRCPKLNKEDINRTTVQNEIEAAIKSPQKEKSKTWWIPCWILLDF